MDIASEIAALELSMKQDGLPTYKIVSHRRRFCE
jgi:hypothetical protein